MKKRIEVKVLDLVLMHKFYDMIDIGDKREEYRKLSPYWAKRLFGCRANFDWCRTKAAICCGCSVLNCDLKFKDYSHIRFHRGYTSTTMLWTLEGMEIGKGREEWGAPKVKVFILKLGKRL